MIRAFIFVLLDIYLWIVTDPQKDRQPLISTLSPQPRNSSKFTSQEVRKLLGALRVSTPLDRARQSVGERPRAELQRQDARRAVEARAD